MIITSLSNNHIKELNHLKEKKYRDKVGKFLIEGDHLAQEAFKAGLLEELITTENSSFKLDCPITYVTKEIINKLSSMDSPPSVIGVARKKKEEKIGNKILILEDIQDPGNLGTIIRSSLAFGIDTLVLSPKTVDLYNPKVIRSTEGMLFHLNIIVRELPPFINKLKEANYQIFGTKVTGGKNVREVSVSSSFALIIGNEGKGMSDEISALCDENLYIPISSKVESLNAAVASSILLYELGGPYEFN